MKFNVMAKQKEKTFSVEMLEIDGNHKHHNPILNFICKEKDLENSFIECCEDKSIKQETFKELINNFKKNKTNFINNDIVYIEEISLSKKFKPSDKYYYRIDDYNENKATLGCFNEVIDYLKKKIKNKYALISYNGINEKIEFSEDIVTNVLSRMTAQTHVVVFNQLNIRGEESDSIMITPFKIM